MVINRMTNSNSFLILCWNLTDIPNPDTAIPLPNVSGKHLEKVIQYCQYHLKNPTLPEEKKDESSRGNDDISDWDRDFCKVDQATLFELILVSCKPSSRKIAETAQVLQEDGLQE